MVKRAHQNEKYPPQKRIRFEQYKDDPEAKEAISALRTAMGLNKPYRVVDKKDATDRTPHGKYAGDDLKHGDEYGLTIRNKVIEVLLKAVEQGIPIHNFEGPKHIGRKTPLELAQKASEGGAFKDIYRDIATDLQAIHKTYTETVMEDPLAKLAEGLRRMLKGNLVTVRNSPPEDSIAQNPPPGRTFRDRIPAPNDPNATRYIGKPRTPGTS